MTERLNWTEVTQAISKWLSGKEPACQYAGDMGSIPGLRRSRGGGNGNSFQYSCLENPTDRGAWQAIAHRVAKNRMWLSEPTHARSHTNPNNPNEWVEILCVPCPRGPQGDHSYCQTSVMHWALFISHGLFLLFHLQPSTLMLITSNWNSTFPCVWLEGWVGNSLPLCPRSP